MRPTHLLLLGAGHAHVEVLRSLAADPVAGLRVTVVSRESRSPYSGMLPGVIAGTYTEAEASIHLAPLAGRAGATFRHASATAIDPIRRTVQTTGDSHAYDLLSIDIGAAPGAPAGAIPVKPIDGFVARLGGLDAARRIAVVGGGPAGLEIALALRARLPGVRLTLLAGHAGLLPSLPSGVRGRATATLARRDIALSEGHPVTRFTAEALHFAERPPIPIDAALWCTAAAAPALLAASGLPCDAHGFLHVNAGLDVPGQPNIFAVGDAAHFLPGALPKSGLQAVRQGPVLAGNLRRALAGLPPLAYRPQSHALLLLATGDGRAIATRAGYTLEGRWAWRWKQRIDRAFIRRYSAS